MLDRNGYGKPMIFEYDIKNVHSIEGVWVEPLYKLATLVEPRDVKVTWLYTGSLLV